MATSNQDTNIKDVAAPASATTTNIGHVLGLNAAKTQDVLIPLSMLRTVIAAELKTALAAITSGSPDVPVLDGNNLKYMTLANFAKVVGGQSTTIGEGDLSTCIQPGVYRFNGQNITVGSQTYTGEFGEMLVLAGGLSYATPYKAQIAFLHSNQKMIFRVMAGTGNIVTNWHLVTSV